MPELSGFRDDLMKFSGMMVPTFWYQFVSYSNISPRKPFSHETFFLQELLELNPFVKVNMWIALKAVPVLQPTLIVIFALLTVFASIKVLLAGRGVLEAIQTRSFLRQDNKTLEISLAFEEQEFIKK